MTPSTIKRWKRDALETMHNLKPSNDTRDKHTVTQASRVVLLTDLAQKLTERLEMANYNGGTK